MTRNYDYLPNDRDGLADEIARLDGELDEANRLLGEAQSRCEMAERRARIETRKLRDAARECMDHVAMKAMLDSALRLELYLFEDTPPESSAAE